jgi:hypothetical protein
MGYAFARDDSGNYFFIDRAREPEDNQDFRLYLGTKGKMQPFAVTDHIDDATSEVFVVPGGRLKHSMERAREAEWTAQGGQKSSLSWLPIEDQAPFVYTDLGAYAGERLGTLCDERR